jgi:hypothetical protein
MTATAAVQPGKIDIVRIIGDTFQVLGRNAQNFFILSALLAGLPGLIVLATTPDLSPGAAGFGAGMPLAWLLSVVAGAVLQGALIYAVIQDLNGQRPPITDLVSFGLRNILPLVGVSFLLGIAVMLGLILLVVPGVMMACAWCTATPALIAERTGVIGAFRRSAELTRGNRWRILGLFAIWVVAVLLTSGVMGAFAFLGPAVAVIFNAVLSTVAGAVGATAITVLYVELRRLREGDSAWLAQVFT